MIGPELRSHAFCYLDDISVVTETFEEYLKWLETVLDKITQGNLIVNPEKCEFCRSEVKCLGYVVNRDGLAVNPEKTEPILTYPAPKNIMQLRRFISWFYCPVIRFDRLRVEPAFQYIFLFTLKYTRN